MITVQITPETPSHMLRAIRAACDVLLGEMTHTGLTTQAAEHNSRAVQLHAAAEAESDKAAQCLTEHGYASGGEVSGKQMYRVGEQPSEQTVLASAFDKSVETAGAPAVAAGILAEQAEELDSAGHPWNPELHSSSRAKIADGTWKKRRGAAVPSVQINPGPHFPADSAPTPPVPPSPTAPLVTMNDIYALVTGGKRTINDVIALAQEVGFANVGAFSREATPEQRAEMLRKLEG